MIVAATNRNRGQAPQNWTGKCHGLGQHDRAAWLKPAWHGLGTVLDHPMSSQEALDESGLSFVVDQLEAQYWDNLNQRYNVVDGAFINVRRDTGQAIGVVGSRYEVVQNSAAFAFLDGLVADGAIEYESAFSLYNGRTVCVLAKTPNDTTIADESHKCFVLFTTSHDGSSSIKIVPTDVRVVCANTHRIALGRSTDTVSIRHTASAGVELDRAQHAMGKVDEAFEGYKQSADMLATRKLTDGDFLSYVNALVPEVDEADSKRGKSIADNKRHSVFMNYYHDSRQTDCPYKSTLLSAFNSATQSADHWMPRKRDAEKRFVFSQSGGGDSFKQKAWDTALDMSDTIGKREVVQVDGGSGAESMSDLMALPMS